MALSPLTGSKWGHPIKILWDELKDNIAAKYPKLQGTQRLRSKALEEWDQIPQEKITVVIDSMPRRIEACNRDNGGNNFNL